MEREKRGFFRSIWHGFWFLVKSYFISVGLFFTLLFGFLLFMAFKGYQASHIDKTTLDFGTKHPLGGEPGLLYMELTGVITRSSLEQNDFFASMWAQQVPHHNIEDLSHMLAIAATDKDIKGILIRYEGAIGSLVDIIELRREFKKFKEISNKPIFFHADHLDDSLLLLGSVAQKINLSPAGDVFLRGPLFSLAYFGDALKKLGVGITVVRAGKYKSAFEPFVNNAPSAETLEMFTSLQKSLGGYITSEIAHERQMPENIVSTWFEESTYLAEDAVTAKIIDSTLYPNEFLDGALKELQVTKKVSLKQYLSYSLKQKSSMKEYPGKEGIAFIKAEGQINLDSPGSAYSDEAITPRQIIKQLKWARSEKNVKAVVLAINSPGGSALASDLIWEEIERTKAEKPVVAVMRDVAASGGYYIAAAASEIIADAATITGSIGVIGLIPDFMGFNEKYGVSFFTVNGSKRKNLFDLGTQPTEDDILDMQKQIDTIYSLFIKRVAASRKKSPETIQAIAEGRVWTGQQAKELGLIDAIGGLSDGFKTAKRLSGLDEETLYPLLTYKREPENIFDCLKNASDLFNCLKDLETETRLSLGINIAKDVSHNLMPQELKTLHEYNALLQTQQVLALWPYKGTVMGSYSNQ